MLPLASFTTAQRLLPRRARGALQQQPAPRALRGPAHGRLGRLRRRLQAAPEPLHRGRAVARPHQRATSHDYVQDRDQLQLAAARQHRDDDSRTSRRRWACSTSPCRGSGSAAALHSPESFDDRHDHRRRRCRRGRRPGRRSRTSSTGCPGRSTPAPRRTSSSAARTRCRWSARSSTRSGRPTSIGTARARGRYGGDLGVVRHAERRGRRAAQRTGRSAASSTSRYVPSPVPEQIGRSNYVDNDRVGMMLGADIEVKLGADPSPPRPQALRRPPHLPAQHEERRRMRRRAARRRRLRLDPRSGPGRAGPTDQQPRLAGLRQPGLALGLCAHAAGPALNRRGPRIHLAKVDPNAALIEGAEPSDARERRPELARSVARAGVGCEASSGAVAVAIAHARAALAARDEAAAHSAGVAGGAAGGRAGNRRAKAPRRAGRPLAETFDRAAPGVGSAVEGSERRASAGALPRGPALTADLKAGQGGISQASRFVRDRGVNAAARHGYPTRDERQRANGGECARHVPRLRASDAR